MATKASGTLSGSERVGFYTRTSTVVITGRTDWDGNNPISVYQINYAISAQNLTTLYARMTISDGVTPKNTVAINLPSAGNGTGTPASQSFTLSPILYAANNQSFTITANVYTNSTLTGRPNNSLESVATTDDTRMGRNSNTAGSYWSSVDYYQVSLPPASVSVNGTSVTWTANSDNGGTSVTDHFVYITYAGSTAVFDTYYQTGSSSSSYTLPSALPAGTVVKVSAVNAVGESQNSLGYTTVAPTYSVTYLSNSATSGSVPTQSNLAAGSIVTVKGNTGALARTGYVWNGWTYSGDGGTYYANNTFTMPSGNVTLTANWTPNTFTVNYNGSNGTITASGSTTATVGSYPSTSLTLSSNGFTVPTGYAFGGWSTTQDNTLDYSAGSSYPFNVSSGNGSVTLHAVWNLNSYTVTFNPNGGTVTTTSKLVTYNSTYGTLPTPTFTNYTFNGWFTALAGGTQVTALTTYSTAANTTLYAQWTLSTVTPVFTDTTVGSPATLGVAYSDAVVATSATSYSIASGALPGGLSLSTSTGAISGTPIVQGPFTFVIRATSSTATSADTSTLTINVLPPGNRPSTNTRLTTAKRFIGIGSTTTNAQGTTISADANGYVNLSRMMVYKDNQWVNITNT